MNHCDPSLIELRSFEVIGEWSETTLIGIPTSVDGKYGKALMLDGITRDSVEINNTKSINPMNFSVSFWIKRIPEQQSTGAIISHSYADRDAGWGFIMLGNGTISFEVTDSPGKDITTVSDTQFLKKNSSLQSDEFSHIAGSSQWNCN